MCLNALIKALDLLLPLVDLCLQLVQLRLSQTLHLSCGHLSEVGMIVDSGELLLELLCVGFLVAHFAPDLLYLLIMDGELSFNLLLLLLGFV